LPGFGLNPETEGNCAAKRRGGEQPEVNVQSATRADKQAHVNSIRLSALASLRVIGEAQDAPTHWNGGVSPRADDTRGKAR
jgi:hypothetical protein